VSTLGLHPHLALGAHETAHVLHHPNDGQLHFVAEADFLPDVLERHLLRSQGQTDQLFENQRQETDIYIAREMACHYAPWRSVPLSQCL
jgi:hypothetical protein